MTPSTTTRIWISPENGDDKLLEFAVQAGATGDKLKMCQEFVRQREAEGHVLDVTSPTTFVDGRCVVTPNQEVLEQYIQFDSTHAATP